MREIDLTYEDLGKPVHPGRVSVDRIGAVQVTQQMIDYAERSGGNAVYFLKDGKGLSDFESYYVATRFAPAKPTSGVATSNDIPRYRSKHSFDRERQAGPSGELTVSFHQLGGSSSFGVG